MGKSLNVEKLLWIDMEMTGLDPQTCHILEVATIVTDLKFERLEEWETVVFQPQDIVDGMDDWCKHTHGKSGLTEKIPNGMPLDKTEEKLVEICKTHFPKDLILLCGNTIGQDRKFIERYMPKLEELLHYRMVDVSSFKEIYKNCYGIEFKKKETHRAKDDIEESINELTHYLEFVQVPGTSTDKALK